MEIFSFLILIFKYIFSISLSSYIILNKADMKRSFIISLIIFLFFYFSSYYNYIFLINYSQILIKAIVFIVLCLIFIDGDKKENFFVGILSFLIYFILDFFV